MKTKNNDCSAFKLIAILTAVFYSLNTAAQIEFEDVSEAAGLTGYTESWGGTWGDYNADNWPDLFNQGHRDFPRFYRNTGEGTFEDIAYEADPGNWIANPFDDKHGASFADYDNDGDLDLLVSVSATGPAQLLVNFGSYFEDHAVDADLNNDSSARQGVWFDWNHDGHLDVAQVYTAGARLRLRDPDDGTNPAYDFDNASSGVGFSCNTGLNYGQLFDLNNDGLLEFMCADEGVFPVKIYDYTNTPFVDVTSSIPTIANVNDSAVADLDGDLLTDMVLTRGALRPSGAHIVNPNRIEAWLRKDNDQPAGKGFYFESNGEITVAFDHSGMGLLDPSKVHVLSPTGTTSVDVGPVRVDWIPGESRWRAWVDAGGTMQAYLQIDTVVPVSNLIEDQFDTPEFATETVHLVNNGAGGMDITYTSGLYQPVFCDSVVTGDFDNDMDQDIYLVCRRGAENLPNRLYENDGTGHFTEVLGHGGEGPLGVGFSVGVGESVVTSDYDVDGFLDLYVTNGLLYYPVGEGGPDTLLRNKGNSNHWLEIDLVGMNANRDGLGAKVYVTAGGITQLREQNGGYHRWSQNDQRLHFGLGANTVADVTVEWPSGATDNYVAVAANTLYEAYEGGAITPAVMGSPIYTELSPGDECGEPPYDFDYGPVILLWKNCSTGVWSMRAKGGRVKTAQQRVTGTIEADAPFGSVSGFNLGGGSDYVNGNGTNELSFSVGSWYANDKGINFSTAGQSEACLDFSEQDIDVMIVGGSKKKISAPLDLISLGACIATPPPPGPGPECGDPNVIGNTDNGVYVWKDCDYPGPAARWNVVVSGGGATWGPYSGDIHSDVVISATGSELEASDELDTVPGDEHVDWVMKVGGAGRDAFQIDVPAGSATCFIPDSFVTGSTYYMGAERNPMTGNFDMLTMAACDLPPPPEPDPECGPADYDQSVDNAILVWRDCAAPGPDQHWTVRVSGGGVAWGSYLGSVTSAGGILSASGLSLEGSDVLDSTPGDGVIDFDLKVGGTGMDGFDVTIPAGADACLNLTQVQGSAQIELGADRTAKGTSLDLGTLGACL